MPPKTDSYNLSVANVAVEGSPYKVDTASAEYQAVPKDSRLPPAPIDSSIDKWFFISGRAE